MTPEGRVKEAVKKVLKKYAPYVYYHMPVQNGMGRPTLDFIGCVCGRYFAVETKADTKSKLTVRQAQTSKEISDAGGHVYVVNAVDSLELLALDQWLDRVVSAYGYMYGDREEKP